MGLGSLKTISLASACEKAMFCRFSIAAGIDPVEARKRFRSKDLAKGSKVITFDGAADAYISRPRNGSL